MEIFGIGPLELLAILIIALIILGPKDMVTTARKLGRLVYRFVRSPLWRQMVEIQELPKQIIREAGLEESLKDIRKAGEEVRQDVMQTARSVSTELKQASGEVSTSVNQAVQQAGQEVQAGMHEAAPPKIDPAPILPPADVGTIQPPVKNPGDNGSNP